MFQLIIVAGGSGQRMGGSTPKQFLQLDGKPILQLTLEAFHRTGIIDRTVVVLPKAHIDTWRSYDVPVPHEIVAGGPSRTRSVQNGLALLDDEGVVGIHDGVRPLVSTKFIERCFKLAVEKGSAVPALPIRSSVRQKTSDGNQAMDRSQLFEVQTPQCFSVKDLKDAYDQLGDQAHTDDATVFEMAGNEVHLVDGEDGNIKITTPMDLRIAQALIGE